MKLNIASKNKKVNVDVDAIILVEKCMILHEKVWKEKEEKQRIQDERK